MILPIRANVRSPCIVSQYVVKAISLKGSYEIAVHRLIQLARPGRSSPPEMLDMRNIHVLIVQRMLVQQKQQPA